MNQKAINIWTKGCIKIIKLVKHSREPHITLRDKLSGGVHGPLTHYSIQNHITAEISKHITQPPTKLLKRHTLNIKKQRLSALGAKNCRKNYGKNYIFIALEGPTATTSSAI